MLSEKLNLRDFFAHLFVGLSVIISIGVYDLQFLLCTVKKHQVLLKDSTGFFILVGVPAFYFLGHLIQAVDYAILRLGFFISKCRPSIGQFLFFSRVYSQVLKRFPQNQDQLLKSSENESKRHISVQDLRPDMLSIEQNPVKYLVGFRKDDTLKFFDYYYIMFDMLAAVCIVLFCFSAYSLFQKDWYNLVVFLVLFALTKFRSYIYSGRFVDAWVQLYCSNENVKNSNAESEYSNPDEKQSIYNFEVREIPKK